MAGTRYTLKTDTYGFGPLKNLRADLVKAVALAKKNGWSVNDFIVFTERIQNFSRRALKFGWYEFQRNQSEFLSEWHNGTDKEELEEIFSGIMDNLEMVVKTRFPSRKSIRDLFGPSQSQRARNVSQNLKEDK